LTITRWVVILMVILALLLPRMVYAEGKGTTGAQFLKLPVGPRPAALGGAFCGVADDTNAIWWNPAGLGFIEGGELTAMHNIWFEEINYEYLGCLYNLKDLGTLGGSVIYLHMDEMSKLDWEGNKIGTFTARDLATTLSYGRRLTNNISLGSNLKYIHQENEDHKAQGLALDLGGLMRLNRNLTLGTGIQNIRLSEKITFIKEGDELPLLVKVGGSYRALNEDLLLALDLNIPSDNPKTSMNAGVEYWIKDLIAARIGYKSVSDLGSSSHFTYGFGLRWKEYGFDAAYLPYSELNDAYLLSFMMRFGGGKEEEGIRAEEKKKPPLKEIAKRSEPKKKELPQVAVTTLPKIERDKISSIERVSLKEDSHLKIEILSNDTSKDFLELYVAIRNNGEGSTYINPLAFTLVTQRGEYPVSERTYLANGPLLGRRLKPSGQVKGRLVFEVPQRERPIARLVYHDKIQGFKTTVSFP